MSPAGRPNIPTSISPQEALALAQAAAGRRVLEVGTAWGFSAVLMALAGATVTAVDHHEDHATWEAFQANLDRYGVRDRVHAWKVPSSAILPLWEAESFDLVFIDGDHSEAGARFDLREARRLVRPGGAIAAHDYTAEWPGVVRAVELELAGLPGRRVGSLYLASVSS